MRLNAFAAAALACLACTGAGADIGGRDWLTQHRELTVLRGGALALAPYYRFTELYDTNIYLAPRDQPTGAVNGGVRSSWITGNDLGLEASLPWRHVGEVRAGYDLDALLYGTQPGLNNAIDQAAHLDLTRAAGHSLTFKAGDRYENTSDQAFSELTRRARRWMNRAAFSADYAPPSGFLTAGVDADHRTDKYLDPGLAALLNRYQDDAGFNVGYKVGEWTKAYASYHRQIIHFTVNPAPGVPDKDSKSHSAAAGLSGALTAKISGRIEGGLMYREYDAAPLSGAPRVVRAPTVSTELTYRYDENVKAVLGLSRYLEVSVDPANPFYYSNNASLDVTRRMRRKFTAGLGLAAGKNQYSSGGRRDDLYQGRVSLDYDLESWLATGVSYTFRERASTQSAQFDYADQLTAWNVELRY